MDRRTLMLFLVALLGVPSENKIAGSNVMEQLTGKLSKLQENVANKVSHDDENVRSLQDQTDPVLNQIRSSVDQILAIMQNKSKECPAGFLKTQYGCYLFNYGPESWSDAKRHCEAKQAHLVAIETAEEMKELKSLMGRIKVLNGSYWTGGSMIDDVWVWDGASVPVSYTNWQIEKMTSSKVVSANQVDQLQSYLNTLSVNPTNEWAFDLLYRATRDGMSGQAFHTKCDAKGSTVSLGLKAGNITVYGGYTPTPWSTSGKFGGDACMPFRLCDGECASYKQPADRDAKPVNINKANYGPAFGIDTLNDVVFFTGSHDYDKKNSYFASDGACASDGTVRWFRGLGCGSNVKWTEVEVFKVIAGPCIALQSTGNYWQTLECNGKARYICEV